MRVKKSILGFTLIELLLSIGLLGFISVFVTSLIKKSIKRSERLNSQSEQIDQIRSAFDLMGKDVNLSLNAKDINTYLYNEAEKSIAKKYEELKKVIQDHNKKKPTETKTLPPKPKSRQYNQKTLSYFEGTSTKLNLTTLNSLHFQKSKSLSDQVEVGYFVDDCKLFTRSGKRRSSQCLWRRQSGYIDDKFDEGGTATILLTDISEAEFKYLHFNSDESEPSWETNWSSSESPKPETKDKFPLAVRLKLKIVDPKNDKNSQTHIASFRLNYPNNWTPPTKTQTTPTLPDTTAPTLPGATTQPVTDTDRTTVPTLPTAPTLPPGVL